MRNDAGINGDAQRIEQMAWMLFLKVYDAKEQDWDMNEDAYESIIPEECQWCNWAVDNRDGKAMTGDTLLEFVNNTLFPVLKGKNILNPDGSVKIQGVTVTPTTPVKKSIVRTAFEDANQYMKDGVLLRQIINIIDAVDLTDYEEIHAFGFIYESILKELQSAGSAGEYYTPRAVTDFMAKMIQPKIGEKMADFACGTGGFITSWLKELEPQIKDTQDQAAYDHSIYGIEKKQFPYILCMTNMLLHGLDIPNVFHANSLTHDVLDYTEDDQFDVILMNPPYGGSEKTEVKNHFPDDLASSETAELFMAVIMYRLKKNGRAAVIMPDGFLFGTDNTKVAIKKKLLHDFNLHTVIRLPRSVFSPYTPITTNILFFDNTKPTEETWYYRVDIPSDRKHFSKTKPMEAEHFSCAIDWWNNRHEIICDGYDKAKKYTVQQLIDDFGYDLNLCGYPHSEEEILPPQDLLKWYQNERMNLTSIFDKAMLQITQALATEEVLSHTDIANGALRKLAQLDIAFPESMQKSILQFAFQGKLVEQRPDEGTGEELLLQIQTEKQMLIAAGTIKKEKVLPEITEDEIPFDIPDTWQWVRVAAITTLNPKNDLADDLDTAFIPMPCVMDGFRNLHTFETKKWKEIKKGFTHFADGDIGVAKITPCFQNRKSVIFRDLINGYGAGTTELTIVRPIGNTVLREYLLWFFKSDYFITNGVKSFTGTAGQQRIHKDYLATCLIPLPPLEEQRRIVAKLEEILPLCDRLK